MSTGLTLEEAQMRYRDYLNAEQAVLLGQEYELATGEKVKKANLKEIQAGLKLWKERCNELATNESGRLGVYPIGLK